MDLNPRRVVRAKAGLMVVDMQERLVPVMSDRDVLLPNVQRLVRGCGLLSIPVTVTEQYPKGLGRTVPELRELVAGVIAFEKVTFSAWGAPGLPEALAERKVTDVLLCGIEAHVCVTQTCLDLLDAGMRVFVVADAICSRTRANRELGLERMRQAGGLPVSTEMMLFELMETAARAEFKALQRLVK